MAEPGQKHAHLWRALLVGCALLPLATVVPRLVVGMRGACLASDFALLELSTDEATRGMQWVGPYSRFSWRHPGPAYFYLLAPLYRLSGGSSASLPVGALVINLSAMLAMAVVLGRRLDAPAALAVSLALAIGYGVYLGHGFVYNVWNPAVTVLPFGLLLLSSAAFACGGSRHLPVLVVVGSFLVQTHVAYLPPVLVVITLALWLWMRARRRGEIARTPHASLALALAALILLWALPLVEQLTRTPGNLGRIASFFLQGEDGHAPREALAVVAREIAWPWSYLLSGARNQYAPYAPLTGAHLAVAEALALVWTALLVWCSFRAGERPYARSLARVCLACACVAVPALMRVAGEIRPYVTTWISMVGTLGALAALAPLLARVSTARSVAHEAGSAVLVAGLALAVTLAGRPVLHDSEFPPARAMSDSVVTVLHQRGTHRPQVVIQTRAPEVFYAASAVLLQMHKRGVEFAVDRPWWNFFGERWQPTGAEDDTLEFLSAPAPDDRHIAYGDANGAHVYIGARPKIAR